MTFPSPSHGRDRSVANRSCGLRDLVPGRQNIGRPGHIVDLGGHYVLPGIIDLHGDAYERLVAPRPSAVFPLDFA